MLLWGERWGCCGLFQYVGSKPSRQHGVTSQNIHDHSSEVLQISHVLYLLNFLSIVVDNLQLLFPTGLLTQCIVHCSATLVFTHEIL
jgi:hypothetical protein